MWLPALMIFVLLIGILEDIAPLLYFLTIIGVLFCILGCIFSEKKLKYIIAIIINFILAMYFDSTRIPVLAMLLDWLF